MDTLAVLDQLRAILVERLKFDAHRAAGLTLETPLPKGIDGSLGLDSLDFIEVALGIEERFGLVLDEREDLAPHFQSLGTLVAYIGSHIGAA
jgi:acyl carrier protein